MPKTRELTIECEEVRIVTTSRRLRLILDEPDIDDLLAQISLEDLMEHIRSDTQNKPEFVFDVECLEKWAEENGYIKQKDATETK